MRDNYYQLSLNDRKNYINLKKLISFKFDDIIQFISLIMIKRKKQLIKNIQSIIRIESHFDWLKIWYIEWIKDNDYDLF